jgi:hypothetical protein
MMASSQRERELGNIVPGGFTSVLARLSRSFLLIDCVSVLQPDSPFYFPFVSRLLDKFLEATVVAKAKTRNHKP